MEALRFSKTARRTFHDVPYVLTISGDAETLGMEVEHVEDGRRWRSQFGARFIEEITQRTGNHKKFDVFIKMMLSALAQESDAVYLDVLTARDLEMLRRHANPQGPPTTSTAGQSDKRYLILTYRAEFDKVHYPLPLQLDEQSEEDTLRALVSRLRADLSEAKESIASLRQGSANVAQAVGSKHDEEYRQLQRSHSQMAEELTHQRREADALKAELRSARAERERGGGGSSAEPELRRLKETCQSQKAELKSLKDDARQRALNQKRETELTAKDLRAARQNTEKLQSQVRKLEDERRAMGLKLQNATRAASTERSRPSSRTPSADRSRPPSRPASRPPPSQRSRPTSRASSVASSRDRTPSPSQPSGTRNSYAYQQRNGSPNSGPGPGRSERQVHSPGSTLSPYGHVQATALHPRRTPSPGQRSRDRTPSPGQQRGRGASAGRGGPAAVAAAVAGSGAAAVGKRSPFSLREQRAAPTGPDLSSPVLAGGSRGVKPVSSSRYGGGGGARPGSAARGREQASEGYQRGSHEADARQAGASGLSEELHRPGSLFGLAADLGLGPGSLAGGFANAPSSDMAGAASASEGDADACDIDARLQALQSFLKQTKTITG